MLLKVKVSELQTYIWNDSIAEPKPTSKIDSSRVFFLTVNIQTVGTSYLCVMRLCLHAE